MPMSPEERESWGRICERVDALRDRIDRLEQDLKEREKARRTVAIGWWHVIVGGLFLLAGSWGGSALIVFLAD
jgi:hypothetical protein